MRDAVDASHETPKADQLEVREQSPELAKGATTTDAGRGGTEK
jgi:hypothetical protein